MFRVSSIIIGFICTIFVAQCFASTEPPSSSSLNSSNPIFRLDISDLTAQSSILLRLVHGSKLQHFGGHSGPSSAQFRFNLAKRATTLSSTVAIDLDGDGNLSGGDLVYALQDAAVDQQIGGNEYGVQPHKILQLSLTQSDFASVEIVNLATMTTAEEKEHLCFIAVAGTENFTAEDPPSSTTDSDWFWFFEFSTDSVGTVAQTNPAKLLAIDDYDVVCHSTSASSSVSEKFESVDFTVDVELDL